MKEESEILSDSDKDLRNMLGSLYKIEAPKDFDFHLKAKIANANPKKNQPSFAKRFVYVLPATALAVAVGAFGFYTNFVVEDNNTAVIEPAPQQETIEAPISLPAPKINYALFQDEQEAVSPNQVAPDIRAVPIQKVIEEKKATIVESKPAERQQNDFKKRDVNSNNRVSAGTDPRVINRSEEDLQKMKAGDEEKEFSSSEVFGTIGIETFSEGGKLRVKSVRPNSPAARSGISENDVIDSINDKKVTGDKIRAKTIEVNKIKLKRGESDIELDLKTKQQ